MSAIKKLASSLLAAAFIALFASAAPVHAQSDSITVTPGTDRFGDLVILEQLFRNNSPILSGGNNINLGDLILLDQAFNRSNPMIGGQRLADLFVLDRIFGNSNSGILNRGNGTNLGDVFILDQLF